MSRPQPDALSLSRSILRVLIRLNLLMGLLILALLVASVLAESAVMGALVAPLASSNARLRVIMVLGICAVPLAHVVLTRLLAIVETVSLGDPFVSENATRLQTIAWAVLGMELLHLAVGAAAAGASSGGHTLDLDWNLSLTRWLAVLLLFVLSRVFEQGARMRDELQGTV